MLEEILTFSAEHLDSCAHVYVETFKQEPWNECWSFETARVRLWETLNTPGFVGFVLHHHEPLGFILGYCEQFYDGKHFFVKDFCVQTDKQHQGIGTKLLNHLTIVLTPMNVSQIFLLTLRDGQAEAFYSKNGYCRSPKIIVMSQQLGSRTDSWTF
ncbi:GNAT family N-acetyltransferase [Scytonema millei]|uniref:GNAT family N-acetyltransferase n=1 Tax=Scytonema millei VB511283 TaxID=1245923 RepID=A0A9X5E9F0_9CYAN|nr:GNAT family N-acetyltransferase [Scytonema millei]NHC37599.1 GNAT family N-acetyltransferase [Scytonema millei VB511283]